MVSEKKGVQKFQERAKNFEKAKNFDTLISETEKAKKE